MQAEAANAAAASDAGGAAHDLAMAEHLPALHWVLRLGALAAAAVGLFNLFAYFQTGAWQMLALAGATALAAACLLLVSWRLLAGRQQAVEAPGDSPGEEGLGYSAAQSQTVGYWVLAAMLFIFGAANLLHSGITPYLVIGGLLLTLIIGALLLPGRWRVWLAAMVGYGLFVWLVNWLEPLPRYDLMRLSPQAGSLSLALIAFLALAALAVLLRAYWRVMAIRMRLLLTSVLVVLLTAVVVATALVLVGSQNGRQQAINQLESIANIKQGEIDDWVAGVESDLDAVVRDSEVMPRVLILLKNPGLSPAQEFFTWSYLRQMVAQTPRLEALLLLDQNGRIVLSTGPEAQGEELGDQAVFQQGLEGFYLEPPTYSPAEGRAKIVAVRPVVDQDGQTYGVVMASMDPSSLSEILGERAWVGETGELYLVNEQGYLLSELRHTRTGDAEATGAVDVGAGPARQSGGSTVYVDYRGVPVVGTDRWLPELGVGLVAKQDMDEALSLTNSLLRVLGIASVVAFGVAAAVSLVVTRSITRPLADLTEVSERIAGGDLSLTAPIVSQDEIGTLGQRFNTMTAQMRELIGTLEERVVERTQELERRSSYLEASAEIGRATSSILDPEELIRATVELVRNRFDLSMVGLFLLDADGRWAVLRAGTVLAGDVLLERGHRIEVRQGTGPLATVAVLTSSCIRHGQARVSPAMDPEGVAGTAVGAEALPAAEQEPLGSPQPLPAQPSEAALPLRSRGQVLGALVVQDVHPDAFDDNAIAALQTMADQVAIALDNAQLFVQSQQALEAERRAYGQISREAWMQLLHGRRTRGYRCDEEGVTPLTDRLRPPVTQGAGAAATRSGAGPGDNGPEMVIPVVVREQIIGTLVFRKEEPQPAAGTPWSDDELTLMQSMAQELGQALESARLYEDTQRRAAREQAIRQVTDRMRQAVDVEAILQSAVVELAKAMGAPRAYVRLGTGADLESGGAGAGGAPTSRAGRGRDEPAPAESAQPQPLVEAEGAGASGGDSASHTPGIDGT